MPTTNINPDPILDGLPDISSEILFQEIEFSNIIGATGIHYDLSSFIISNFDKSPLDLKSDIQYDLILINGFKPIKTKDSEKMCEWIQKYLNSFHSYCSQGSYLLIQTSFFSIWTLKSYYLQKLLLYELTHLEHFSFLGYNQDLAPLHQYESLFLFEFKVSLN